MQTINNRLKIAIQKKGRLYLESIDLLRNCGLQITNYTNNLIFHCKDLPIDLLFVRDDDIPTLVANKICDLGIVGQNVVLEKFASKDNTNVNLVKKLEFGFCRLAIAASEKEEFIFPNSLDKKRIATSYPNLLQAFLNEHAINAMIVPLSGSVEIAVRLEIADYICDLVSSGQTLEANHLKLATTILNSQAVLISSEINFSASKQAIFELLLCRIDGVLQANTRKYILFHTPRSSLNAIQELLPGTQSPTILPLQNNDDLVAVHVVSAEAVFWDTLEKLKKIGASSILVLPIEKMLH